MYQGFPRHREVCLAILVALGLSACGGGGGGGSNVRPVTPAPPTTPSGPTQPTQPPQPPLDAQLSLTDTYAAHNLGYTGKGVTIGVSLRTDAGQTLVEYFERRFADPLYATMVRGCLHPDR